MVTSPSRFTISTTRFCLLGSVGAMTAVQGFGPGLKDR
jgi:hypothetical protein